MHEEAPTATRTAPARQDAEQQAPTGVELDRGSSTALASLVADYEKNLPDSKDKL